jgi:regulatory protein
MGRITALKVQKRNQQRVSVYLDDRFAFGLAAIEAARLKVGQVLSDEEIALLRERDAVERAVERALNLLAYRPRSRVEVCRRLREKGHEEETIERALDRLERAGLLDDLAFARYWVDNRFQFNPRGVVALRRELRQKGIEGVLIDEVLAEYDEEAAAAQAAEAAVRRLRGLDPAAFCRRLRGYLSRRGFPYAIIQPLVEQALADHSPEESLEEGEI